MKPQAHRTTHFVPEDYPKGQISRVNIEIIADGLGVDVLVPMLVARGRRDGPVFGLTAAVHGNELNGIRVIHDFFNTLDVNALRGTLVGVVCVNVPALHSNERELHGEFDLNRVFPGRADGNSAQVYAYRLLDRVISTFDRLVDLHTASFGRINSLYVRADLNDPITRQMALLQRPQIIVHNRPRDRSLRGAAMEMQIPAITVEVGDPQRYQPKLVRSTRNGIRDLMTDAGMLPKKKRINPPTPILCDESAWIYTDRGGLLEVLPSPAERVKKGEVIARTKNAFGDVTQSYYAPSAGVVIGKSTNPVAPTGARILHLGIEASDDSPLFAVPKN